MTEIAIIVLTASVCWLIIADRMRELGSEIDALLDANRNLTERADYWHEQWVTATRGNVRPVSEAPSFDRIAAIIARNEAERADWDEPSGWQG